MSALAATPDLDRRRKRRLAALLILVASAVVTFGAGSMSLAVFTDSENATGAFTTGTIDISTTPTALFNLSAIFPGASGSATLNVSNGGTGALRYAMTTAATNTDGKGLRDQLSLTITAGSCPGGGAPLYGAAALSGAAFGNPNQGAQAGDRALAAGANEDLCFAWSLPLSTGNAFQAASTTATFTFSAEQTANNP
ncbi:MAG TPA: TasA family protein [Candidatus Limnocylindrales bacterium]|jgi:predicted ribosomally synthesized peptide with SipW-like signal peptide